MKNILFVFISAIIFLSACKEKPVEIPPLGPKEVGERKVLVEEFTGVRCVNCPDGSAEIENLKSIYGENLISVSIHSGFFSTPYPESQYNFQTEDGDALASFLGEPQSFPSAIVDRKDFENNGTLQESQSAWSGLIAQELDLSPKVSITLENTFDAETRNLDIKVTVLPYENISQTTKLTVLITETDIVDTQLTGEGKIADYHHKHVLHDVISAVQGDEMGSLTTGSTVEKTYQYVLPEAGEAGPWVPANCRIVAFVTLADTKEVLQVDEKEL